MPTKHAQLDALGMTEAVRERLVDFALDDHFVRDKTLSDICRRIWSGPPETGGLLSELWVEGAFPAKDSDATLDGLAASHQFNADLCNLLDNNEAVPRLRFLFTHQLESILRTQNIGRQGERPAVVVTAGTGTGKTECFLLPILNELFNVPRRATGGIQCLILYPMNALVNDQVDRLYHWLRGQDRVTLFHFTSETPEDAGVADRRSFPEFAPCRMRTRKEARGLESHDGKKLGTEERGPVPDIVITNYSMLEYMLCRPQDAVFFGPALKAIVLDEAHLYTGTLAAEITLLLRRLYARCGVQSSEVVQFATSATLKEGAADELKAFAATLFSKEENLVQVVEGKSTRAHMAPAAVPRKAPGANEVAEVSWLDQPLLVADNLGNMRLADANGLSDRLRKNLSLLTSHLPDPGENHPARILHEALRAAPLIQQLEEILWEQRRLPLPELARKLWNERSDEALRATTWLLQLAASARLKAEDYPLVPHRIHLLVRAADSLGVCLNEACSGPAGNILPGLGVVSTGTHTRCPHCKAARMTLSRCASCGEWLLSGEPDGNRFLPAPRVSATTAFLTTSVPSAPQATQLRIKVRSAERNGATGRGVLVAEVTECPCCGAAREELKTFLTWTPLALAILAETVLAELPEFPAEHNPYLPARGRRLLAFSDSRQEAARLGPRLTRQHEIQLVRSMIIRRVSSQAAGSTANIQRQQTRITQLEQELQQETDPAVRQTIEEDLQREKQRLQSFLAGGSMEFWATNLGNDSVLAEIVDLDTSGRHAALYPVKAGGTRPWGQKEWEQNGERIRKQTLTLLASEFASPRWRAASAESLGYVEVTYPGLERLTAPKVSGEITSQSARNAIDAGWQNILRALCDTLRVNGCVSMGDEDHDRSYLFAGRFIGQWSSKNQTGYDLVPFSSTNPTQRRRRFMRRFLQALGLPEDQADRHAQQLLAAAFDQLFQHAVPSRQQPTPGSLPWLERDNQRQTNSGAPAAAIRILFPKLGLRRPVNLFQCKKTGRIWYRSILGWAPDTGCEGTLESVTESELDNDPRFGRQRREYRDSEVFRLGLWAEEHSAQLDPRENRRLQDLFKAGIRNILSSTTTLELGIDIGGLTAALISNVPPGKANYLQRAGRAGRRSDGSSAVVTFIRPRPFDREVFSRFGDFLGQDLLKPQVFLERERIVRRHLHSWLLGEFFRTYYATDAEVGAMRAFGNMDAFCGVPRPVLWRKDEKSPPSAISPSFALERDFRQKLLDERDHGPKCPHIVQALFAGTTLEPKLPAWPVLMDEVIQTFDESVQDWRDDYDRLFKGWSETILEAQAADDTSRRALRAQANAIRYQLKMLGEMTVIEALADRQFLPRYGFPIGLQKLRVIAPDDADPKRIREEDQYRLERPGLLSLGEYVPGSQLLAGGKLITSRGVLKHWTGANLDSSPGLRGRFATCERDHLYYTISDAIGDCPLCGGRPKHPPMPLLFTKYGFSSAAWDPPRWSTDVERVGRAERLTLSFKPGQSAQDAVSFASLGGVHGLAATYKDDGELLVYNKGDKNHGFAICLKCGYADSEVVGHGTTDLPSGFESHLPLTSADPRYPCWKRNELNNPLRNQILAARERTDVLLVDFGGTGELDATDQGLVTTLAYALRRGAAALLELDPRELGVMVIPTGDRDNWGSVLFDNVPGGAGHVYELTQVADRWLQKARDILFVDPDHDRRCDTACLDCLLSFDAQMAMERAPFDRRAALKAFGKLVASEPR